MFCTRSSIAHLKEETSGKQSIYGRTDITDRVDRKGGPSGERIDQLLSIEVLEGLQKVLMYQMTGMYFLVLLSFGLKTIPK